MIARKKNVDHGDSYKQFDGYMTAWFVYHLQGDTEAGKAFAIGGELSANSLLHCPEQQIQRGDILVIVLLHFGIFQHTQHH